MGYYWIYFYLQDYSYVFENLILLSPVISPIVILIYLLLVDYKELKTNKA